MKNIQKNILKKLKTKPLVNLSLVSFFSSKFELFFSHFLDILIKKNQKNIKFESNSEKIQYKRKI